MSTFTAGLTMFAKKAAERSEAVFTTAAVEIRESIKYGSSVTGAPALPVAADRFPRAGALRDSVTLTFPTPTSAIIYTTSSYATDVEDNPLGKTLTNGGNHGWKLTAAAFERIVDNATARLAR